MFVKPMPQPLLRRRWQLQDTMGKTQGLKDFKMPARIHNDMRSTATKLFKRKRLTRLISKTDTGLRVGNQMVEALAQDHRHDITHDLTVARCTQLLELPPATFHVLIVLCNLWTLFVVAPDPWPRETLIRGHQDDMVQGVLFPVPRANHTGIEGHGTRLPQVIHAFDKGDVLMVS